MNTTNVKQSVNTTNDNFCVIEQDETKPFILSIDIGIHNLGWCVMTNNEENIEFGLYDIDENNKTKTDIVLYRTKIVHSFVNSIFDKFNINTVIIERQVNVNTMAMELMYCLVSAIYIHTQNIIIFDPKLKFTTLSLKYDIKNKQHKKLSIHIVSNYLEHNHPLLIEKFNSYNKKDDISDSLLMILTYIYKHDKRKLLSIRGCAM